jgi:diguanylate cyclase (GGDEF)-like protein
METLIGNDAIMDRFNKTLVHCNWLLEAIKPLQILLIDEQDSILSQVDFGIHQELNPNTMPWEELRTYILHKKNFAIQERAFEGKKIAIIYYKEIQDGSIGKVLDYIITTFSLVNVDKPTYGKKGWQKILSLRDVLLHLLYQSDYTRNLGRIGKAFLDYISEAVDGKAVLFTYEKATDVYHYQMGSDEIFGKKVEQLTFTTKEMNALINDRLVVEIKDMAPFADEENQSYLWPLAREGRIYALLFLTCSTKQFQSMDQLTLKRLTSVIGECAKLLFEIQSYIYDKKMGRRYRQLFTVTKKFHSTMDDREVIEEVMNTIAAHYPSYKVSLLFTDEGEQRGDQHPVAVQSFLSGEVQFCQIGEFSILFAPLAGRQGIYGVIEIAAPSTETFAKEDIEFISLLANTAGHAFENAKLYQQSQRSISDLQLINRTSQHLNENLRFNETVDYLLQEIKANFDADEAGFFLIEPSLSYTVYPGSTPFFTTKEGAVMMDWVVAHINDNREALFRGHLKSENRANGGFQSLVALPLTQNDAILGLVVVLHREAYHFSFDGFRLLQSIVRHSSLALANALLREELEYQVITDQLTGLYARDYLNKKVERSLMVDQSGVMILIDIDDFKQINDKHGHVIGDEILIHVADVMRANIRQHDIAARWGGEELAIYLPNCDLEIGRVIAERLVENVQIRTNPRVTISCGLTYWNASEFPGGGQDLIIQADKALYHAKEEGKNRVEVFQ